MTYEYVCAACNHQWEAEQPISAVPLKKCPSCGKAQAKRQVSGGTGFLLKGGGWYADGYGSKRSSSGGDGDGSSSGGSASGTTTPKSKDAKPAPTETSTEKKKPAPTKGRSEAAA